jgi:signal peptidase I
LERHRRRGCLVAIAVAGLATVVLAVGVAYAVKTYWGQVYYVPSEAMSPTLQVGDRILVEKHADVGALPRGTVVVINLSPGSSPGATTVVKRIIGLPGEAITFKNWKVYVNGAPLDEPWVAAGVITQPSDRQTDYPHECIDADPCVVPAGHVWVMGDNRPTSEDSRHRGPIAQDLIVGEVTEIIWPRDRSRAVN